ncbi:MAG: bifunctional 2-C-methyl-D-erythritol 4-phosphate cytidylyltransferase/2-C-methyl-D-erythritol 2,4-cyclodiphosphate synthase [Hyphomicrobiales bacterium]|nr:bifunctional 2-C-methyl-D-erythritol 4-phosphate cytidylyltransferase/2-C-methyl-D-erythritol 2,4-cyclodiphosphate synthase [Hyphomicrobiales bacterium]MDE2113283.1 bifunctional 2-C-methyl-D-erythritol 4-phosphate cytidylyltransferase/2-C-methyl-D-erythritol 2,4-cyclodiphosphate synthase [Hyphomicrobiales bacterium]
MTAIASLSPASSHPAPKVAVLVVAAGRGTRFGSHVPKQFHNLGAKSILQATLLACTGGLPQARIACVIHADDKAQYHADTAALGLRLLPPVIGGATRQASVLAGLQALQDDPPDIVLIHDGVRPFVSAKLLAAAVEAAQTFGAAIPGLSITDTIQKTDALQQIVETLERDHLYSVQTPQAFRYHLILEAHLAARAAGRITLTDDASVASFAGHKVTIFQGEAQNRKITMQEDLARANADLLADLPDIRTGQGFDVHAFGPGNQVWLGGVSIPHAQGLIGHSDADVLLHAITDAILGALADGDIGAHFPPSDPKWRGAASSLFLEDAMQRVAARRGRVVHIDATLICEHPKVGPHREAIRQSIAAITGLNLDRVAVKATTSERLGFTGRGEGIAAMALVTLRLPA